ncbi:hypothetical protein OKW21_003888 [Catalinimonas alkaloidigena]|uniref:DUF4345 family protein n=1 Tax=Catalinimonas alkaloidigena TaxID=1075417 RepID=UPI002405E195|nr:DUF4345 family protein [Catalinimonas alkaloidigena]MDF9798625.1 hypothetical protein [Catalinimonas alkaloidigena]
MKFISYFFFYTYIGLVCLAGIWGAFFNAHLDFSLLMGLDTSELPEGIRNNLLSQYRFLRALEFGFGLFALLFTREIFTQKKFNSLFLVIMASGILARVASLAYEGSPNWMMYFFMIYEIIGFIFIYLHTRQSIQAYVPT